VAKKKNIYSNVDNSETKAYLDSILRGFDAEPIDDTLEDKTAWKQTQNGGVNMSIVASIEKKIHAQLDELKTCADLLLAIYEREGKSDSVVAYVDKLESKMSQIESYYRARPSDKMEDRYVMIPGKKASYPSLAATSEDQRIAANRAQRTLFSIKPIITELVEIKKSQLRSGANMPAYLMEFDD
jgi:hypothetical protein